MVSLGGVETQLTCTARRSLSRLMAASTTFGALRCPTTHTWSPVIRSASAAARCSLEAERVRSDAAEPGGRRYLDLVSSTTKTVTAFPEGRAPVSTVSRTAG